MIFLVRYFPPLILLLFLVYGTFQIFHDRTIATVHPIAVIPAPAIPGQPASVLYQGKENNACDGVVHRWIVDSKGTPYALDDTSVWHPIENASQRTIAFVRPLVMPPGMSGGTAEYFSQATRWCNSFQQLLAPVHDNYSIKFEVRGAK
jgi:hypothetical protein